MKMNCETTGNMITDYETMCPDCYLAIYEEDYSYLEELAKQAKGMGKAKRVK